MEPCNSNHEQIMSELASIKQKMNEDWKYIEASKDDLLFRNRLWNIFKVIGFGTAAGAMYKLLGVLFG